MARYTGIVLSLMILAGGLASYADINVCKDVFSGLVPVYRPTDLAKRTQIDQSEDWLQINSNDALKNNFVRIIKENFSVDVAAPATLSESLLLLQKKVSERSDLSPVQKGELLEKLMDELTVTDTLGLPSRESMVYTIVRNKLVFEVSNPRATDRYVPIAASESAKKEIREKYPKIAELADRARQETLAETRYAIKVEKSDDIPFFGGHTKPPKDKLAEANPFVGETIKEIYNLNQDREAFASYIESLIYDTAFFMSNRSRPSDLQSLSEGKIPRNEAVRVVVSRYISRGDEIGVIKKSQSNNNEHFRKVVNKSGIFDWAFVEGQLHGQDVHLLQVDFAYSTIYKATSGDTRIFWDYIGSKKGIWFWYDLFDSSTLNPTRPEVFGPHVRRYIPFH